MIEKNYFGFGLKINSNGSFHITGKKEFENNTNKDIYDYTFLNLSMGLNNKQNSKKWIYFSGNNNSAEATIKIINSREHKYGGHKLEYGVKDMLLINGWQEVDLFINYQVIG